VCAVASIPIMPGLLSIFTNLRFFVYVISDLRHGVIPKHKTVYTTETNLSSSSYLKRASRSSVHSN
jgi:hypothetical protein